MHAPITTYVAAVAFSFVGSFQIGYQFSLYNQPYRIIEAFISDSFTAQYNTTPTDSYISIVFSAITAIMSAGSIIGDISYQFLCDRFGRKRALVLAGAVHLAGMVLQIASYLANRYQMLIVGRLVTGIALSLGMDAHITTISEIAPTQIRGMLGSSCKVTSGIGVLAANILGLPALLGTEHLWFCLQFPAMLLVFVYLVGSIWLPEGPKYLGVHKNQTESALQSIRFYQGSSIDAHAILDSIHSEELTHGNTGSTLQKLCSLLRHQRGMRLAMLVSVTLGLSVLFSGEYMVVAFISYVVQQAGLNQLSAAAVSIVYFALDVCISLLATKFFESIGRRKIAVYGSWITDACLMGLFLVQLATDYDADKSFQILALLNVILACSLLIHVFAKCALACLSYSIPPELFPTSLRCLSICLFFSLPLDLTAGVTSIAYMPLSGVIGSFAILIIYVVPQTVCAAILTRFCPETAGRSVDDIVQVLLQPESNARNLNDPGYGSSGTGEREM